MGGMIRRDLGRAAAGRHDLLIVGGGIYGATLALEAARRGLEPLLLERDDFGQHTSWNSLRILHGGLRSLQTLDLRRFFDSVAERSWFLRHFPELVEPLPCLMPIYGEGLRRRSVLRLALRLNDFLSRLRPGRGSAAGRGLEPGRILSPAETVSLFPYVDRRGLLGGALWHDAVMRDSQRVVMEILRWAAARGATLLNYVEARELLHGEGGVEGVTARDRETGSEHRFRAPVVVNCAGPWCREVARRFDRDHPALFRRSLAFNLVLDLEAPFRSAVAVAPRRRGARVYFLYPSRGRTLAGTFHAPREEEGEFAPPREELVEEFLSELREILPGADLRREKVLRVLWGELPVRRPGSVDLCVRELVHDHAGRGGPRGLLSVSGVKFTTARSVAERCLRRAWRGKDLPPRDDQGPPTPLRPPQGEELRHLLEEDSPELRALLGRIDAEESLVRLEDLLLRRTDWGLDPGETRGLAPRLCAMLPWSAERRAEELASLVPGKGDR
jgi:glycerol-3-phosphate dehydrogenase